MKVHELIDQLRRCRQNAEVVVMNPWFDGTWFTQFDIDHDDNDMVKIRAIGDSE